MDFSQSPVMQATPQVAIILAMFMRMALIAAAALSHSKTIPRLLRSIPGELLLTRKL